MSSKITYIFLVVIAMFVILSFYLLTFNINVSTNDIINSEAQPIRLLPMLKYGYNLCDIDPRNILFGGHHKSGSILFCGQISTHFFEYIYTKCNYTFLNKNPNKDPFRLNKRIDLTVNHIKQHIFSKSKVIIILNLIRNPIDTILSGYNYHKNTIMTTQKTEEWAFRNALKFGPKFKNLLMLACVKYKIELWNCHYSFILNHINLENGQICEFNRYMNFTLIEGIWPTYKYIKDQNKENIYQTYRQNNNNKIIIMRNFQYENINENFELFMNELFDLFKINNILDRKMLLKKLKQYDKNDNRTFVQTEYGKRHITESKFDKKMAIELLLNQTQRCSELKYLTVELGYKWLHGNFC